MNLCNIRYTVCNSQPVTITYVFECTADREGLVSLSYSTLRLQLVFFVNTGTNIGILALFGKLWHDTSMYGGIVYVCIVYYFSSCKPVASLTEV